MGKDKGRRGGAVLEDPSLGNHMRTGELMETPVFRPTEEEFKDFYAYASTLDKLVGHVGVCKVIPPQGWKARSHEDGVYTREYSCETRTGSCLECLLHCF